MGEPPDPYKDWYAWALAQFDNDPRRAGLAARAATEAQSIGAGIDAAIRAAESAAGASAPSWVPNDVSIEVASPSNVAQPKPPPDFHADAPAGGDAGMPVVHDAAPAETPPPEAHPAVTSQGAQPLPAGDGAPDPANGPPKQDVKVPAVPTVTAPVATLATGPGTISPDGNYIWNGTQWVRNIPAPAPTSTTGPGTVSPDGNYIWTGAQWALNAPVQATKPVKKINRGRRRVIFFSVFLSPFVLVGLLLWGSFSSRGSKLVNYQVTGDGTAAIGYIAFDQQHLSQFTKNDSASLPVSIDVHGSTGQTADLYAVAGPGGGVVTCTITVNGQVIATDTGSGSTGASCKAEIP